MHMRKHATAIDVGPLTIEPDLLTVTIGDRASQLTARDMDVLMCLAAAEGRVLSREKLLQKVWQDVIVNDEAVSLSISRIRSALGESARNPVFIHTIPKKGYRLVAPDQTRDGHAGSSSDPDLPAVCVRPGRIRPYNGFDGNGANGNGTDGNGTDGDSPVLNT